MSISSKILRNIEMFYERNVVLEQYPMMTSISRESLLKDGVWGGYMSHHISDKDFIRIPTNEDLMYAYIENCFCR